MGKNNKIKKSKNKNSLGVGFFVIPLIILMFLYGFVLTVLEDGDYFYISPVVKEYNPIEKSDNDVKMENYFDDKAVLFYDEDRYRLINDSSDYFYEKTGVRIFLYTELPPTDENNKELQITDEEALDTCKKIYNELSDEGIDLVLLFVPTSVGFESWTYAGENVKNEFGNKCEKILEQYLYYNFHVVGEYDELFYYSYRSTADRLMDGFTSPLSIVKENLRIFILAFVTIVVIVPSVIIYIKYNRK